MKILHTADWHVGQLFYEYDRTYEHQQFLNWLRETLINENIEALLISGDIFDQSNPSAASVKMFYSFLNQAAKANPDLQIIITAGNHDISIPTEFYSILKNRQKTKNVSQRNVREPVFIPKYPDRYLPITVRESGYSKIK